MKECTVSNAKKISGIHYTTKHTGKMEGMQSVSTSTLTNERCRIYSSVEGGICAHCYSETQMKRYPSMQTPLDNNAEILKSRILDDFEIPYIYCKYFRFEAFGDLHNDTHVINYFKHCYKNPDVKFALWTKNPDYIETALNNGWNKPKNLEIVGSSLIINKPTDFSRYWFIDKRFTVYTKDYVDEHGIVINCGGAKCYPCGLCYNHSDVYDIAELKK